MDHIDLDAETLRKLERLAAARGETPAVVMKRLVDQATPPSGRRPDGSLSPEQSIRARDATRVIQEAIRRDFPQDTRDGRSLQDALYDEHGLPR